jgi:F0F1-type ATP synthase alpha subunit
MAINVAEITSILQSEIASFDQKVGVSEVGTVIEVGDGIARIYGLRGAMAGELLEFENGTMGQVFNLEEDSIGAVVFGDYLTIKEGDSVKSTGRLLEVPVGEAVIGRVVNPLGPADRRRAADRVERDAQDGHRRARHRRAPAGEGAAPDRHQGDRLDDPDRPRAARADHRRPQDRQERRSRSTRSLPRRARA